MKTLSRFLLVGALAAASACSAGPSTDPDPTNQSAAELAGPGSWITWTPYSQWNYQWTVPICWDADFASSFDPRNYTTQRQWVRDAVEESWGRTLHVNFVGWNTICDPYDGNNSDNKAVRIQIWDDRPWAFMGWEAQPQRTGMHLNFTYQAWNPSGLSCSNPASNLQMCIRNTAVHEFGHLLGWQHEQDSPAKSDPTCAVDVPNPHTIAFTTYDPFSVMNYCPPSKNGQYLPGGDQLSAGDIAGARQFYGGKFQASIVDFSGKCVDVTAWDNYPGAPVQVWDCNNQGNQKWYLDPNGRFTGYGSRVLSAAASAYTGEQVKMEDVSLNRSQQIGLGNFEIVGYGDLCLTISQTIGGYFLTMDKCTGAANQLWYQNGSTLGNRQWANECFGEDASGNITAGTCTATASKLLFTNGGQLHLTRAPSLCLDTKVTSNTDSATHTPYNTYPAASCTGLQSQNFHFKGTLSYGGMCLDARAFGEDPGTALQWWPCNGMINQTFEYYP